MTKPEFIKNEEYYRHVNMPEHGVYGRFTDEEIPLSEAVLDKHRIQQIYGELTNCGWKCTSYWIDDTIQDGNYARFGHEDGRWFNLGPASDLGIWETAHYYCIENPD